MSKSALGPGAVGALVAGRTRRANREQVPSRPNWSSLVVQIVAGLCPGAGIIVYFAAFDQQGWVDLLNEIVKGVPAGPVAVSVSWGWPRTALTSRRPRVGSSITVSRQQRSLGTRCGSTGSSTRRERWGSSQTKSLPGIPPFQGSTQALTEGALSPADPRGALPLPAGEGEGQTVAIAELADGGGELPRGRQLEGHHRRGNISTPPGWGFTAGPGFDAVSGWGVPDGPPLVGTRNAPGAAAART